MNSVYLESHTNTEINLDLGFQIYLIILQWKDKQTKSRFLSLQTSCLYLYPHVHELDRYGMLVPLRSNLKTLTNSFFSLGFSRHVFFLFPSLTQKHQRHKLIYQCACDLILITLELWTKPISISYSKPTCNHYCILHTYISSVHITYVFIICILYIIYIT